MYRRIKKRNRERGDPPEQRSLFNGTIVKCVIAVTILASSAVEATVPDSFQSAPNLQKSSNTERIASNIYVMNSNGNTDEANNDYDQLFDPWNPTVNNAEESTTTEGLSSNAPPLDSQQGEDDASGEEEETQTARSSSANVDPNLWQQHSTPGFLSFVGLVVLGGLALFLFCGLNLCILMITRAQKKTQREKDTLLMFSYMSKLNVEDMDIRRSPAGGFHVAYLNGLAVGENSIEEEEFGEFGENSFGEFGENSMEEFYGEEDDDDDDEDDDDVVVVSDDEPDANKGTEDSALPDGRV
jgi:hypothetical protein